MSIIPPMPPDGSIIADLNSLKLYVGARTSQDDEILQQRLDAATEWVYERVYDAERGHPDVQECILLRASRLYKRRQSPEGDAGWLGESPVVRMLVGDRDEESLIDRHRDYSKVGIG